MEIEVPPLPPQLRLSPTGHLLTVRSKPGRSRKLPVVQLRSAALSTVGRLVAGGTPQVVVAPHFTKAAKQLLEKSGWGWIDGNGSARIVSDDLYVHIERPQVSRTSTALPLPPQADRIVRHLLDNYPREFRLTEIATATDLDKGYTSRMIRRLLESGTVAREGRGPIRVTFPAELFELWSQGPDRAEVTLWFASGEPGELAKRLQRSIRWSQTALTGVYAAAVIAPHVTPERLEVFVTDRRAAVGLGRELNAERVERGPNIALLVPRDPAVVRIGGSLHSGHRIASITQVYRDVLQRGRGREREAADFLRRERLKW